MTKRFKAVRAALLTLCLLATAACSTDDDISVDISQYNDCIITKMTMGTMFRNVTNADTTYRVGVTGSLYPLSIDHRQGLIFNNDSLPVGTDVTKVAFSELSSSGYLAIHSLWTGNDTAFVATDSTNCSTERLITVTAYDEVSKRSYRLHINVHQEEGDSMTWQTKADGNSDIASFEGQVKAVGGIPAKVEAARQAGLYTVLIPLENSAEAAHFTDMDIRPVSTIREVLEQMLVETASLPQPQPVPAELPLVAQGTESTPVVCTNLG